MNNKLSILIAVIMPMALFSCKKCYVCEKPEYCLSCFGTVDEYSVPLNDCYSSEEERATAREAFEAGFEFAGGTVTCLETENKNRTSEFCENKKNRDAEIEQWEVLGYTCSEE